MENIKIGNREFYFQIASDVIRDGIGIELWEISDGQKIHCAEIFRNDNKKQIEFTADVKDLPFQVVERLIELFNRKIPKEYQE